VTAEQPEQPANGETDLSAVVAQGDRLVSLYALRDATAAILKKAQPREFAPLSRRLIELLDDIASTERHGGKLCDREKRERAGWVALEAYKRDRADLEAFVSAEWKRLDLALEWYGAGNTDEGRLARVARSTERGPTPIAFTEVDPDVDGVPLAELTASIEREMLERVALREADTRQEDS
jgi:hypothetical protein